MIKNELNEERNENKTQLGCKVKPKSRENEAYGGNQDNNITIVSKRRKRRIPNIKMIEKHTMQYIIGQDEQVRRIILAIYRAMKCKTIKSNVLVIGKSGTGKTETIGQIAKYLGIPYTIEDATKYTKEGYYGADVNEMIYNLIDNADQDIEKAQRGIIIIDEIDKKAGHEENDVSGKDVLKSLLKIIEGTKIKIPSPFDVFEEEFIDFDTKNIIIIFAGAFSGLEEICKKRQKTNTPMGFNSVTNKKTIENTSKNVTKQDLVAYGMPEEFVGRIDTIIEMNNLKKEDLSLILKKSRLSILKRYQRELKSLGVMLYYPEQLLYDIADKSMALDTGARELSNTVNHMFENILYEIFANPGMYTKCKLFLDIVNDNTKYKLS